ncbi:MAG: OB-fold nucleic acid binding domain-containing protein [Acidobacteriota bacterium]
MKIFISDFVPNQNVSTTLLVKSKELRTKKTGGQFVLMTLSDKSGDIAAQWWDNFDEVIHTFDREDIVFVRGLVNTYRNHLQLAVHRMRRCDEREIDLAHYFPTTKYDTDEMFAELMETVRGFRNVHLRRLLEGIFANEETARKFRRAPAAKTMHHPYLGGLLEHSLSLVRLCRKVGEHYSGIDVDLLQTGAVLHDFGKIDELSYERGFGYTTEGQLIGHLTMETIMVSDHIREIPDFPSELRQHLLHLLITHHGKLEHGSPKLPMTPEALMLSYLDDLDSKVEAMQRLIADPHATGEWTRISPMFERPVYRRRTIEPSATISDEATGSEEGPVAPKDLPASPAPSAKSAVGSFNTPFQNLSGLLKD